MNGLATISRTMYPVVLHHGLFGFTNIGVGKLKLNYFGGGIRRMIAGRGHPVIVSRVHPTAAIDVRARQLQAMILRQLRDIDREREKVIILAHSLGGLDARYMISKLGMEDRVAAVVSITTPHRGTAYADWCCRNLGQRLAGFRLMRLLNCDVQAIRDLTTESCARFNEETQDAPGVKYFSISAARPRKRLPAFAMHSHKIVEQIEGDNDGLVSIKSSTWANHLGIWPADHWHTINKRFTIEMHDPTGDITPYYSTLLDHVTAQLK